MKQNGFIRKVAAGALSLAMVLSMAAPMTVLAEEAESGATPTPTATATVSPEPTEAATATPAPTEAATATPTPVAEEAEPQEVVAAQSDVPVLFSLRTPRDTSYHGDLTSLITTEGEHKSYVTVTPAAGGADVPIADVTSLNYGDTFNVFLDWNVPDTTAVHANDTFTYQLPGVLDYAGNPTGKLMNGAAEVGTYAIDSNGLVTLTYTTDMLSGIHGTLNLQGVVDTDGLGTSDGGNTEFKFPNFVDETILVNRDTSNDNLSVSKTMTPVSQDNKNLQNVVIAVNATGPQTNVNVTDVMGDFLNYQTGTFSVYSNANCTEPYTGYTGNWDNVTFPSLKDQTVYIKYQVAVDDKVSGYDQWNIDQNKNKVSATTEGHDKNPGDDSSEVHATVDNTWQVDKSGTETDGNATWTITIDPGHNSSIDGTTIKELLGPDIGTPTSVTMVTANRGETFAGTGADISWDALKNGTFTLNGSGKKYQITVVTPLENAPTAGKKEYNNKVEVTPYGDGQVKTGTGTIGVGTEFDALTKECTTTSKSASTLEWKTTVTAPDTGLTNAVVSDTVGYGHTLVYGTNGDGITVTNRAGGAVPAYTIAQTKKDDTADANSFTIKFTGPIPAGTVLDITYKTNVTATANAWPSNTAYLKATELGDDWKEKTASHEFKVHLEKWGANAENGKFTWHAVLENFSAGDLTDSSVITVVDTLPENNTFVDGSVSVTELWGSTPYEGVTASVSEVDGKPTVTFTVAGAARDALIAGKNINIQYNTILTDPGAVTGWTTYTNTIKAVVDGHDSNPVSATGSTDKPNVLKKTYSYDKNTAPLAKYEVDINPSGLDLVKESNTVTLKDTMGTGLQLMANTVQISADGGNHYTNIGEMGPGYSVAYDPDTHIMTLVVPDSTPLKLKYSVLVTLEVGTAFTAENGGNKIELTGENSYQNSTSSNLSGSVVKSSGTSESTGNAVQIYKYEDGNISKALSGAHFKVEQITTDPALAAATTAYSTKFATVVEGGGDLVSGAEGLTGSVGKLANDTIYRITETTAPPGFRIGEPIYFVFNGNTGIDWATTKIDGKTIVVNGTPTFLCNAANVSTPVTEVTVRKFWNDKNNAGGKRPDITGENAKKMMTLWAGTTEVTGVTPTLTTDGANAWVYTWSNLPAQDSDGNAIVYKVQEKAGNVPAEYGASTTEAVASGETITNTYPKPAADKVSVSVTKNWVDNGVTTGRPALDGAALTMLTLLKNGAVFTGAPEPDIKVTGNTWTYTWSDLAAKDGDVTNVYTVKEDTTKAPSYNASTTAPVENGGTITNTLDTVTIHITKQWNDTGYTDKRPSKDSADAKALMQLYQNDVLYTTGSGATPTISDNGDNTWTYTWSGLLKQDDTANVFTYTVKEDPTKAPGYTASTTEAVGDAKTITNTLDKGKISVTKVDADNTATKLAGATFGVYTDAAATVPAKDAAGQAVTITTTAAGNDLSVDLPVGTYYVKETTAPTNYLLNATVFTAVVVKGKTTPLKTGENAYVSDAKNVVYGKIKVTKVDADNTTTKLAGAIFGIFSDNTATTPVIISGKKATITTTTSGDDTSVNLPTGTYYVKEIAPPAGYNANNEIFTVTVTEDIATPVTDGANAYVTDAKSKGQILITKVDAENTELKLKDATFAVYTDKKATAPALDGDGNSVTITTGEDGTGTSVVLPVGTYYVKETVAPADYELNETIYVAAVIRDAVTPVKIGTKKYIPNNRFKGQIGVTKVDAAATSTKLAGAVFTVYTDAGATTPAKVSDEAVTITTTAAGNDLSVKLPVGTYYVKETTAPEWYDLNPNIFEVVVTKDAVTEVKTGSNAYVTDKKTVYYGSVSITKHSVTLDGKKLSGCSYVLYRMAGTQNLYWTGSNNWSDKRTDALVLTTGADGSATATGLPVGTYYFLEVNPPKGYLIDEAPIKAVISPENAASPTVGAAVAQADKKVPETPVHSPDVPTPSPSSNGPDEPTPTPAVTPTPGAPTVTPTVTPTPVGGRIPRTADSSMPLAYALGMAAALLGLAGLYAVKRRKN